jgi:hypothetical protein
LNYCLYRLLHRLAGRTNMFSFHLKVKKIDVRICPIYLSEFIVSGKKKDVTAVSCYDSTSYTTLILCNVTSYFSVALYAYICVHVC